MVNLNDIFKENGLSEEQSNKIFAAMKENKIFTASEENLDVRYSKLKGDYEGLQQTDAESKRLIAELQKATAGQEDIQNKISEYEATIEAQEAEIVRARTEAELKFNLLAAGAKSADIDYLIYKMVNGTDWKPELTDDGKIKGIDDKLSGMKTQFPAQFESSTQKKIEEKKLNPKENGNNKVSADDFRKMGYKDKLKLFNENPELYNELTNGK